VCGDLSILEQQGIPQGVVDKGELSGGGYTLRVSTASSLSFSTSMVEVSRAAS